MDEYSLPDIYKSATSLSLGEATKCASCRGNASTDHSTLHSESKQQQQTHPPTCTSECSELVYSYEGLVYRIVSHPPAERDQNKLHSRTRESYLNTVDKLNHKISSAETRSQNVLQSSIVTIEECFSDIKEAFVNPHSDKLFLKSLLTIMKQDKVFCAVVTGAKFDKMEGDLTNGLCKLRTLMSCAIDYAGFRLQVFCPLMDLSGQDSLVKGLCESNGVYVDSSIHVNYALSKVSKTLNISMGHVQVSQVSLKMLSQNTETSSNEAIIQPIHDMSSMGLTIANIANALTKELQIHKSADGRFYALNLHTLLPCELPTAATDSTSRLLRPEFVTTLSAPLSALAFRTEDFEEDSGSSDDLRHIIMMEREIKLKAQDASAAAIEQLYTVLLPNAAGILDSLAFVPIDSYSLTNFLHLKGICCRHLGALHDLCTTKHAREILLTQAIARCCKILHARILRNHGRATRAASISAEYRRRSGEQDFRELHKQSLQNRRRISIGFFNVVFGSNEESTSFWTCKSMKIQSSSDQFRTF